MQHLAFNTCCIAEMHRIHTNCGAWMAVYRPDYHRTLVACRWPCQAHPYHQRSLSTQERHHSSGWPLRFRDIQWISSCAYEQCHAMQTPFSRNWAATPSHVILRVTGPGVAPLPPLSVDMQRAHCVHSLAACDEAVYARKSMMYECYMYGIAQQARTWRAMKLRSQVTAVTAARSPPCAGGASPLHGMP